MDEDKIEEYKQSIRESHPGVVSEEELDSLINDLYNFWEAMVKYDMDDDLKNE